MAGKVAPDILGLGLGLTSWVFPDIHVALKIGLTLLVIIIIIFIRMDKAKQTTAMKEAGKLTEDYIMPGLGGALRGAFFALIGIMIANVVFNIHLVNDGNYYTSGNATYSTVGTFLHVFGNLTSAGNAVLCIAIIFGAVSQISAARKKNNVQG